jgi:hypothetical protein
MTVLAFPIEPGVVGNLTPQAFGLFQEGWIEPVRFEFSVGGPTVLCSEEDHS